MEDIRRYVSIAYLISTAITGWVLMMTADWILSGFGPSANPILFADIQLSALLGIVLALGLAIYCWRNEDIYGFTEEVAVELSKVTWPDADDTRSSTYIVIIFAAILGGTLALFDLLGRNVIDLIFRTFT
jgi:preprotein translocase SecE subunit